MVSYNLSNLSACLVSVSVVLAAQPRSKTKRKFTIPFKISMETRIMVKFTWDTAVSSNVKWPNKVVYKDPLKMMSNFDL